MYSQKTERQPLLTVGFEEKPEANVTRKNVYWKILSPVVFIFVLLASLYILYPKVNQPSDALNSQQRVTFDECSNACDEFSTQFKVLDAKPSDLESNFRVDKFDPTSGFMQVTTCNTQGLCFVKELTKCTSKIENTVCPRAIIDDIPLGGSIAEKWKWKDELSPDTMLTLTFAIKQTNLDLVDKELLDVSDPKSENYGQHWTYDEIHTFLKPNDKSLDQIKKWLFGFGIVEDEIEYITPFGDFIRVPLTVLQANALLNAKYGIWENPKTGKSHIRIMDKYSVPESIAMHLDFISPTVRFPFKRHTRSVSKLLDKDAISVESRYVFPEKLKNLYSAGSYSGGQFANNSQAIASFLEEWFDMDDLTTFWEYFSVDPVEITKIPQTQPSGYGDEAELDVQYITAMGGIHTAVHDVEDDLFFITLIQQILRSEHPPYIVSMSYGGDEQSSGSSYCNRANVEFAKAGLLGVTLFASSGDSGSCGDGDVCGLVGEYLPSFPASSPYVTAVGGTYGGRSSDVNTGERAWYLSGGGFSTFFSRQSWQDSAVLKYLSTNEKLPASKRYNASGRGYPDISAQSVAYIICIAETLYSVSGTSCSSPSVAGLFSLVNDYRLAAGKSSLGFLNPALYQLYDEDFTEYFNDVSSGYNKGCGEYRIAFFSQVGWDPVTGVGTPKLSKILEKMLTM